jgi:cytochrome d ubiquinol oxidase subunit II
VAFEFRLHGRKRGKPFWTAAFAGGSLTATVAQGFILGGFIQGLTVRNGAFAGGPFDWLTPYTLLVALGLVCGYALLGAGWLYLKTENELHGDARRWAAIAAAAVFILLFGVSLATLWVHPELAARWGIAHGQADWSRLIGLSAIPILGLVGFALTAYGLVRRLHGLPYLGAGLVFLSGYLGLAVDFFPYVAPYALTYEQAASSDGALAFMGVGVMVMLPLILGYTAWVYWIFRGKVAHGGYH